MKRKINLITICLLFLLFGLVGCGNVQSTKKVQAVPTQVQSQTQGRESYNKNLYRNQENKFNTGSIGNQNRIRHNKYTKENNGLKKIR